MKIKTVKIITGIFGALLISFTSCETDDSVAIPTTPPPTSTTPPTPPVTGTIDPGNDPNFTIVAKTDESTALTNFNRKVVVFGVDIFAAPTVDDAKLLHAANVMAQYLDNNEDGTVDNQLVVDKMLENKALLFMWKTEADQPTDAQAAGAEERAAQDLGNDETIPVWHTNGHTGQFDAALEEIWHIITLSGYAQVYPDIFGEAIGSSLGNAMDIARGGHFTTIPNPYPADAWYTYNDETCDYGCQAGEYTYWAMTSILGAQENRLDQISNEWRLNTRELVESTDSAVYALLTDPQYSLPTVLPDGTYRQ